MNRPRVLALGAAVVLSALLLVCAIFYARAKSAPLPLSDDLARKTARYVVRELLGEKMRAAFPADSAMKVVHSRDRALVVSHVDARDRFGATRRIDFLVEFEPSPHREFWALKDWRLGNIRKES